MKSLSQLILVTTLFGGSFGSLGGEILFGNKTVDILDLYIPTLKSSNEICRKHSLFYKEELEKFTVWATDMFDASSKFPSGLFSGSIYDTGNFDVCVGINTKNLEFSGQHCMAHFKISPLVPVPETKTYSFKYDKYDYIYNLSTWEKISKYAQDPSKQIRDEINFSFCLPSSCSYIDLENVLKETIIDLEADLGFNLNVSVKKQNCQIDTGISFTRNELIYIFILLVIIVFALVCTFYHHLTKLEEFECMKLKGRGHEIMVSFSFAHTIKKMAKISNDPVNLRCLHGIKVLSMFVIIAGHRIMFSISSPVQNSVFVEFVYRLPIASLMLSGPILVDTFFTISGFLVSYHLFQEISKPKNRFNYAILIIHRIIRFTPVYAIVIGFYCTIFYKLGSGPFWEERIGLERERCQKSWWANLLYVNNFVNLDYICMFQSWYLTCDVQFFLLAPLFVIFIAKKPRLGSLFVIVLINVFTLIPALVIYFKNENPTILVFMRFLRDPVIDQTFQNVYIPSYMRASPYLIGIYSGYLKYKIVTEKFKFKKWLTYSGWIACSLIAVTTLFAGFVFYLPSENKDLLYGAVYGSLSHMLWGVGTAWMILALSEGQGDWIAPLFNWSPLTLLSRITLPAFLSHGAFQLYTAATNREPVSLGLFNNLSWAFSDIVWAYLAGFVLSLLFEAPIMELEKILLFRPEKNKPIDNKEDKYVAKDHKMYDIYIPNLTSSFK